MLTEPPPPQVLEDVTSKDLIYLTLPCLTRENYVHEPKNREIIFFIVLRSARRFVSWL